MRTHWMIDNAEALRASAAEARRRGQHTGKSAPGWDTKRPEPELGTWSRFKAEQVARWESAVAQAKADFDWDARLEFIMTDGGGYVPF